MNEFQAIMGRCNLKHLPEELKKREEVVKRYREHLSGVNGIVTCEPQKDTVPNHAYVPIVVDEKRFGHTRDEIQEKLAEHNIFARKYFYPLTNDFACYRALPTADPGATPVAGHIADRVLTLPMYAELEDDAIDRICDVILR